MTAPTRGPSPTHHYRQRPGTHRVLTTAPKPRPRRSSDALWDACCRGDLPAEMLSTRDREDLVYALHQQGWTDVEIASHTRMTSYTVDRIRTRIGLQPNESRRSADVA